MKNRSRHAVLSLVCVGGLGMIPAALAQAPSFDDISGAMTTGAKLGSDIVAAYGAWEAFSEAHDGLVPDDRDFDPDYDPPGSPQIPSACAESEECNACYEKAVRQINFYRFSLDKGRGIANNTLQYAKKALAFGDTASGTFGVGGLSWSLDARPEIEKATAKLRKTYQAKYGEWISGLEAALQELGQCEEENFGEQDWYGRFGYIYYSFMADRYKSPD